MGYQCFVHTNASLVEAWLLCSRTAFSAAGPASTHVLCQGHYQLTSLRASMHCRSIETPAMEQPVNTTTTTSISKKLITFLLRFSKRHCSGRCASTKLVNSCTVVSVASLRLSATFSEGECSGRPYGQVARERRHSPLRASVDKFHLPQSSPRCRRGVADGC